MVKNMRGAGEGHGAPRNIHVPLMQGSNGNKVNQGDSRSSDSHQNAVGVQPYQSFPRNLPHRTVTAAQAGPPELAGARNSATMHNYLNRTKTL